MNSFKKKSKKIKRKHDKKRKKDRKRRRSSSSSSDTSSDSSTSSSSSSDDKHKGRKRKHKKDHKRKTKRLKEKLKTGESSKPQIMSVPEPEKSDDDFAIPIHLMDNKQKAPETKEEYEKRQSVVRRVVDEETGRTRLIKGDGEVIEEIVSKDRHREINKLATQTDGQVYQNKMLSQAARK